MAPDPKPRVNECQMRRIIRAAFESTDDYLMAFQRAVQAVMREVGVDGTEARAIVMRLRGGINSANSAGW